MLSSIDTKWGIKQAIKKHHIRPFTKTLLPTLANAAPTVGVYLQGEFEEMKSFRLAVAKYSLVHGITYKVETSTVQNQLYYRNKEHRFLRSCKARKRNWAQTLGLLCTIQVL
jgi:hypothetical protein